MIVTIHQPEHLPWLGFFNKICQADVVVLLNNVQFRKNYFQNRNKIKTADGWAWLTVPIKKEGLDTKIKDISIDNSKPWAEKCWNSIKYSYNKAEYFTEYGGIIESFYNDKWIKLDELNTQLIRKIIELLSIKVSIQKASDLKVYGKSSDLILDICRKLDTDTYLSGISGREYLKLDKFKECGIDVVFQDFHHPVYKQLYQPFIPNMSIIDLLFNSGPESSNIVIGENDVPTSDR
jgi:hypothetical protein|tara:strand:+ start:1830 stop:2534 length:705 start_codon:yes stop_codon:yes gene_type:complete